MNIATSFFYGGCMEIIFDGKHNNEEAYESFASILKLLKERYQIDGYREMHLSVTLVDEAGEDVELVDSQTNEPFRIFEVYRDKLSYAISKESTPIRLKPRLKLVVDNTPKNHS